MVFVLITAVLLTNIDSCISEQKALSVKALFDVTSEVV